jgi:hypothetical protein
MHKRLFWLLALAMLCLAPACGKGDDDDDDDNGNGNGNGSSGSSWTVMVYMVADNDLEPFSLYDLQEMAAVGGSENLNIVVQSDRAAGYAREGIGDLPNWESTKRLEVLPGDLVEVEDIGEANMGEPAELADFVEWAAGNYPADRYFLVFWNHGSSWPGFGGDESTFNGVEMDMLTLAEMKSGLTQGMAATGLSRFDIIGFDACLMATYESVVTFRDFADYLLASEELEPGTGWDYSRLQTARSNPAVPPAQLGSAIIDGFQAANNAEGETAITLSLTDLTEVGPLIEAVEELAGGVAADPAVAAPSLMSARSDVQEFGKMPDETQSVNTVDLYGLADRLAGAPGLASPAQKVKGAIDAAVVKTIRGPAISEAAGLSIYLPSKPAYYKPDYDKVQGVEAWRDALKAVLGGLQQDTSGPVFTNADKLAECAVQDGGTLAVAGTLDPASATDIGNAYLLYGVYDSASESEFMLGSIQASVMENEGVLGIVGYWQQTALVLTQGGLSSWGYLSLEMGEEGATVYASIPFLYSPPGEAQQLYVSWVIGFEAASGEAQSSTLYAVSEAGFGELSPEAGSLLQPLLLQFTDQGPQWVQEIDLALAAVPPEGTDLSLSIYLIAEDYAGNYDYVWTDASACGAL